MARYARAKEWHSNQTEIERGGDAEGAIKAFCLSFDNTLYQQSRSFKRCGLDTFPVDKCDNNIARHVINSLSR